MLYIWLLWLSKQLAYSIAEHIHVATYKVIVFYIISLPKHWHKLSDDIANVWNISKPDFLKQRYLMI